MKSIVTILALLICAPAAAQTPRAPAPAGSPVVRTDPHIVRVAPTESLQDAIIEAEPGTTILLQPGGYYNQSAIVPKPITDITITTDHFSIGDRAVRPTDAPVMATLQAASTQSYALWLEGSRITVRGIHFLHNTPRGQGEMVRDGDAVSPILEDVPHGNVIVQNYFSGNPGNEYGQKRAIAANGADTLIEQNFAEDIWAPGQDSQCVAVFSTPGPITIRRNVFVGCASENIMVGGTPPAGPAFVPSDILIEENVLAKPEKWVGASPARVVKDLFEIKSGRRITVRRNWMERHWQQAQPGPSIVLTMATNGACSYCDMRDVVFEDNVVWDVSAGLTLTGWQYTYAPGAGQAIGFTIRNNLFYISKARRGGTGRPLLVSNEPKTVIVDRNTFIHDASSIVTADYGTKWPYQQPPLTGSIAAGPLQGFVFTNNLAWHSNYGIFTPDGNQGVALATYFPGAIVGGNVMAGAPPAALTKYNAFAGSVGPNVGPPKADFDGTFDARWCQSTWPGKGADCSRLPWELRALVPQ